ncbi:transcription factor PAR2-like [Dendrobium catenatum]|uniref:Transcription factor bHLH150 n=1 Tax=Dendrobium catenatum TaxID=906689 RepID=A0A2I0X8H3_9ASPA|nr:transcription factor PAR2-like [Dendrobium catenatum]PKU84218.1 Transcription factor bHLH150 [Dendrobium catenatum]
MENKSNRVHYCLNKVEGRRMRMLLKTTMMPSYEDRQRSLPVHFHLLSNPLRKDTIDDTVDKEAVEEIDKRVRALKKLVPGTEEMDIKELFEETVVYIAALERKVDAMRGLTSFLDGLEMRSKRDF